MKALSYLVLTLWLQNLYMKCTLIKWTTNTGDIVIHKLNHKYPLAYQRKTKARIAFYSVWAFVNFFEEQISFC